MSSCQLRTQALQHIGGITEKLAIVPDIYSSLASDSCKRVRSEDSDCLSIGEEDLELLGQFQETKHPCGYSLSPSPDQFQLVENSLVFTAEVKDSYNFGGSEDAFFSTCGGNSPVSTSSCSPGADFGTQVIDFGQEPVLFPVMQHTDKYKLVITEQPEEVCSYASA